MAIYFLLITTAISFDVKKKGVSLYGLNEHLPPFIRDCPLVHAACAALALVLLLHLTSLVRIVVRGGRGFH